MAESTDEPLDIFERIAVSFGRDTTKGGRPTKEEQRVRELIEKGIAYEFLRDGAPDFFERITTDDPGRREREREREPERHSQGLVEFLASYLFKESTIEKYRPLFDLSDETVQRAIVQYGPPAISIAAVLAGLWWAEENIQIPTKEKEIRTIPAVYKDEPIYAQEEGEQYISGYEKILVTEERTEEVRVKVPFPPVLHTIMGILLQTLQLLSTYTELTAGTVGATVNTINKIGQDVFSKATSGNIADIVELHPAITTGKIVAAFAEQVLGQQKKAQEY